MKKLNILLIFTMMMMIIPLSEIFGQVQKPTKVIKPYYADISRALRDVEPVPPGLRDRSWKNNVVQNILNMSKYVNYNNGYNGPDPVLQHFSGKLTADPVILQNFDGGENLRYSSS